MHASSPVGSDRSDSSDEETEDADLAKRADSPILGGLMDYFFGDSKDDDGEDASSTARRSSDAAAAPRGVGPDGEPIEYPHTVVFALGQAKGRLDLVGGDRVVEQWEVLDLLHTTNESVGIRQCCASEGTVVPLQTLEAAPDGAGRVGYSAVDLLRLKVAGKPFTVSLDDRRQPYVDAMSADARRALHDTFDAIAAGGGGDDGDGDGGNSPAATSSSGAGAGNKQESISKLRFFAHEMQTLDPEYTSRAARSANFLGISKDLMVELNVAPHVRKEARAVCEVRWDAFLRRDLDNSGAVSRDEYVRYEAVEQHNLHYLSTVESSQAVAVSSSSATAEAEAEIGAAQERSRELASALQVAERRHGETATRLRDKEQHADAVRENLKAMQLALKDEKTTSGDLGAQVEQMSAVVADLRAAAQLHGQQLVAAQMGSEQKAAAALSDSERECRLAVAAADREKKQAADILSTVKAAAERTEGDLRRRLEAASKLSDDVARELEAKTSALSSSSEKASSAHAGAERVRAELQEQVALSAQRASASEAECVELKTRVLGLEVELSGALEQCDHSSSVSKAQADEVARAKADLVAQSEQAKAQAKAAADETSRAAQAELRELRDSLADVQQAASRRESALTAELDGALRESKQLSQAHVESSRQAAADAAAAVEQAAAAAAAKAEQAAAIAMAEAVVGHESELRAVRSEASAQSVAAAEAAVMAADAASASSLAKAEKAAAADKAASALAHEKSVVAARAEGAAQAAAVAASATAASQAAAAQSAAQAEQEAKESSAAASEAFDAKLRASEALCDGSRAELESVSANLSKAGLSLSEAEAGLASAQAELESVKAQLEASKAEAGASAKEVGKHGAALAQAQQSVEYSTKVIEELEEKEDTATARIAELEANLASATSSSEGAAAALHSELDALKSRTAQAAEDLSRAVAESATAKGEVESCKAEAAAAAAAASASLSDAGSDLASAQAESAAAQAEAERLAGQLAQVERDASASKVEHQSAVDAMEVRLVGVATDSDSAVKAASEAAAALTSQLRADLDSSEKRREKGAAEAASAASAAKQAASEVEERAAAGHEKTVAGLELRLSEAAKQSADVQRKMADTAAAVASLRAASESAGEAVSTLDGQHSQMRSEVANHATVLDSLAADLDPIRNQMEELEELVDIPRGPGAQRLLKLTARMMLMARMRSSMKTVIVETEPAPPIDV